jgi:hypothetical protein
MEERDEERRREVVANDLISLLPKDGSASAYSVAIAIRELIEPIVDRSIGSGAGMGTADLQVEIGGVQYIIEVRPCRSQRLAKASRRK